MARLNKIGDERDKVDDQWARIVGVVGAVRCSEEDTCGWSGPRDATGDCSKPYIVAHHMMLLLLSVSLSLQSMLLALVYY